MAEALVNEATSRNDVYGSFVLYVRMIRRTTIEIDQDLLERAKDALGQSTTRGTVEEALRRVADTIESERERRALAQRRYLVRLADRADVIVLASEEMWR